jgi:hypothetical protein
VPFGYSEEGGYVCNSILEVMLKSILKVPTDSHTLLISLFSKRSAEGLG